MQGRTLVWLTGLAGILMVPSAHGQNDVEFRSRQSNNSDKYQTTSEPNTQPPPQPISETDSSLTGRRPIPNANLASAPRTMATPSSSTSLELDSSEVALASGVRPASGSRRKTSFAPAQSIGRSDQSLAKAKTNWLPPLPSHSSPAVTIQPSLPRYDTRVANNQRRKPAASEEPTIVRAAFYGPQPPSIPTFPGDTFPPSASTPTSPPAASPGTFPPGGSLPTYGGSGNSLSDSPPSTITGQPISPQPLIPNGTTYGGTGSNILPNAQPNSGVRAATPPAAAYPMPGIAGQGSSGTLPYANGTTYPNGSAPGIANTYGSTPTAPPTPAKPRYATGEPFVTGPPPQYEMPYTHAVAASNSCLPGWFQSSSSTSLNAPTTFTNNTTSGVYPANSYPNQATPPNPANVNQGVRAQPTGNTYPGVPGYIVPPTVTQNMAPQLFAQNNNGYTPWFNWGTESSNVAIGRGLFGGPTVYVTNEPVRNFFRYVFH